MKIIKSALSQQSIFETQSYLRDNIGSFMWSSSEVLWDPGLRIGIVGSCLSTEMPLELRNIVVPELKKVLPPHDELVCNYHLWQRGSGISSHTDSDYKFGATLYLNDQWHVNYGGIFIWQPKDQSEMRALIPEKNTLVINDESEVHLVTPIAPDCPKYRATVQIWGK